MTILQGNFILLSLVSEFLLYESLTANMRLRWRSVAIF